MKDGIVQNRSGDYFNVLVKKHEYNGDRQLKC